MYIKIQVYLYTSPQSFGLQKCHMHTQMFCFIYLYECEEVLNCYWFHQTRVTFIEIINASATWNTNCWYAGNQN